MTSPRVINANPTLLAPEGISIAGELVAQYPTVPAQAVGLVVPSIAGPLMVAEITTALRCTLTRVHLGGTDVELVAEVLNPAGEPVQNAVVLFCVRADRTISTHDQGTLGTSYWVSHAAGLGVLETMGGTSETDANGQASIISGVVGAGGKGQALATVLFPGPASFVLSFDYDP